MFDNSLFNVIDTKIIRGAGERMAEMMKGEFGRNGDADTIFNPNDNETLYFASTAVGEEIDSRADGEVLLEDDFIYRFGYDRDEVYAMSDDDLYRKATSDPEYLKNVIQYGKFVYNHDKKVR